MLANPIPLSLYIHIPWCIKKCPYCDFNSYAVQNGIPEENYCHVLLQDLHQDLPLAQNRPIKTIFFGGGTPSLFSPKSIEQILNGVAAKLQLDTNLEVTLETNPGTMEHKNFNDYKLAGVNRISLGAQSFQDDKLLQLGRIHKAFETELAINRIINAGFNSFNIDLMYGLPEQTIEDALYDLKKALSFSPPHLSWYNLTIEPNTIFHHKKPPLPSDEIIFDIEQAGKEFIATTALMQYEVSAFAIENHQCRHNLNYWQFGDYLGIGAGAHGKITHFNHSLEVMRYWKTRNPKDYLIPSHTILAGCKTIPATELPLEFMLNALRLTNGIPKSIFEERTGLALSDIISLLHKAESKGLLSVSEKSIIPTELGRQFLNDLLMQFSFE